MISKVKMQRKNTERLKFLDFSICPNILPVDADTDTDTRGIAIALPHQSAGALKIMYNCSIFLFVDLLFDLHCQQFIGLVSYEPFRYLFNLNLLTDDITATHNFHIHIIF